MCLLLCLGSARNPAAAAGGGTGGILLLEPLLPLAAMEGLAGKSCAVSWEGGRFNRMQLSMFSA